MPAADEVAAAEESPLTVGFVFRFLFIWLCSGFAIGTLVLLGPVRWYTAMCRRLGWAIAVERVGVGAMIVLLVVGSAALSIRLTRSSAASGRHLRFGIPAAALLFAGAAYLVWINPSMLSSSMGDEQATSQFTFGPYPTATRMRRLKAEGFTVISLLSPAVVPFEPQLIAQEERLAKEVGIPLLHIPMLPWISGNHEAIEKIRALARDKTRHYYVHCYLGKDRVQIARRVVEEETGVRHTSYSRARALTTSTAFERGKVYALGKEGFLIPCPTDEELVGYILAGDTRSVMALLDPDDPDDRRLIEHERQVFQEQGIQFLLIPAKGKPDPAMIAAAVRQVRRLPHPFAVHAFFTPESGRAPWAQAFMEAYEHE
ncbi:MAG TPA: hypothetical protein VHL58_09600 [Thermoanaerobaculia bacterium]|nr:hypothetical protein [Thermoanaerobaculia bacterium]